MFCSFKKINICIVFWASPLQFPQWGRDPYFGYCENDPMLLGGNHYQISLCMCGLPDKSLWKEREHGWSW